MEIEGATGLPAGRLAALRQFTHQNWAQFDEKGLSEIRMLIDEIIWWRSYHIRFEGRLARLEQEMADRESDREELLRELKARVKGA